MTTRKPASTRVAHDAREAFAVFAAIYAALVAAHGALLRLPYFWDEAGYFIPAARDLLLTGDPIARTTLSNAHPPLVMAWLALWWKLAGYSPLVTRLAALALAAAGLTALYKLARRVANEQVATAAVVLAAVHPVVFAQSSLAQLDVGTLCLTLWAVYFHVAGRRAASIVCSALACVAKETAIVVPLALFAFEVASKLYARWQPERAERWCLHLHKSWRSAFAELLALLPLVGWYAYHFHRTGHVFGNPEYLRYNLSATVTPMRIATALFIRLWHSVGYMNLFVLTGAALLALRLAPREENGTGRAGIDRRVQLVLMLVIAAHVAEFSVLGGALLARYMTPMYPLVVLLAVAPIWQRVQGWLWWSAACAAMFLLALFTTPPWGIAPEDNLCYRDFVVLHQRAAQQIEQHYKGTAVLTAWPASDELNRPFLGYVSQPITVVHVENFTPEQMLAAHTQAEGFDLVLAFSSKYEPPRTIAGEVMSRSFPGWRRLQEKYFDYHQDMKPESIAAMLGGTVTWKQTMGVEWAAIIEMPRRRNARMEPAPELLTARR